MLPIGKTDDLGIINNIIPNIIWKRNVDAVVGVIIRGIVEVNKAENETYYYFVRFEKQPMDIVISFDENNKISGLLISSEHREFKKKK